MKIRNSDNTYTKFTYTVSKEINDLREQQRMIHRLFHPRRIQRQPSPEGEERDRIRRFDKEMLKLAILIVNDPHFKPGTVKYDRVCPRLLGKQPHRNLPPRSFSRYNLNTNILKLLGFVPKKTKSHNYTPTRYSIKTKVKVDEIWSEDEHRFIKPRVINIKKEKKLSPYWVNKIA